EQQALDDYRASGAKGRLTFMKRGLSGSSGDPVAPAGPAEPGASTSRAAPPRQARHLRGAHRDAAAAAHAIDTAGPGVL
ncbi:MAG: hypothetical protein H0T52_07885, partial [Lautropia sp.]|nr:hypothetical protein [Lautropia sp.]